MPDWLRSCFMGPYGFLLSLANKQKGFRRGFVIWSAMQVGWTIHQVFTHMDQISIAAVSAMSVVVVPLIGLIVYYVKLRADDDDDGTVPEMRAPPVAPPAPPVPAAPAVFVNPVVVAPVIDKGV